MPQFAQEIKSNKTGLKPNEHNAHPAYRPDIDGLRAVAILAVVIYHAFPTAVSGGFVGVDIFFVISGFLISNIIFKSLQGGIFSFSEFYASRVRRIFPALFLVLISCFAFGWFALLTDEYEQLGKHIAAGAGFVQNIVLWQEAGYFDTASELKPLMHLWSLAIEEQFYLLYPALIWCAWRFGVSVLPTVAMLAGLSFSLNVINIENDAAMAFFLPQARFWELLTGGVLAHFHIVYSEADRLAFKRRVAFCIPYISRKSLGTTELADRDASNIFGGLGLLLIAASIFLLNKGNQFPGWWAVLPVFGAALLVFAGPNSWISRNFLSNPLMVFIGLISYPLYLWHWPLLAFARIFEFGTPAFSIRLGAVVLSFLLAWSTYRLIESPIRFGKKNWKTTTTLCVLISIVGLIGYNTFQRKGFEFRYRTLAATDETNNAMHLPSFQDQECAKIHQEVAAAGYCKRFKQGKPNVLILGDSHAEHLHYGLATVSASTSLSVATIAGGGCLPFFDVASHEKGEPESCLALMNKAFQLIENTASIETVVLAARGPLYLTGTGFGNALSEYKFERKLSLTNRPDVTDYKEIFTLSLNATLKRLVDKGKQVVFVLDIPELDFDAKSCEESPIKLRKLARPVCGISRQAFDARNAEYRQLVYATTKNFPTVKVFDAAAELCDDKMCWAKKEDALLYSDTNHLTLRGSEYIAHHLVKFIKH